MTQEKATTLATMDAIANQLTIAVVEERYSEEGDPFGYCPLDAVDTLFHGAKIVSVIRPDGTVCDSCSAY